MTATPTMTNFRMTCWSAVGGHLLAPYGPSTNDVKRASGMLGTADDFFQFLRDALDMLYAEGAQSPRMVSVSIICAF